MKKINVDFKYLMIIWGLLIIAIIPTYAHHGHFLYDCGREVYYPMQMLAGKVLYKDIFNLYGPFAYMFNALLYKIFGINLNVLYIAGCISAFFIVSLTYLISRLFLSRFLSFAVSFFTIAVGVVNLSLFNLIFPYSYGMLYGLVAFFFSVWFLLNYQKAPTKNYFLYLSAFFAGICVTNKYEFWAYLLVIIFAVFKIKRLNFKEYFATLLSFLIIPVLFFGILFAQGVRLNDLLTIGIIMKKTLQSDSLKYFYSTHGVFPSKQFLTSFLSNGLNSLITFIFFIFGWVNVYKPSYLKKIFGFSALFFSISYMVITANPEFYISIPFLILAIILFKFKEIINNEAVLILCLSAITLSLKNLFGIITLTYGLFYISFLLLTLLVISCTYFNFLKTNEKIISIYIMIVSLIFIYVDLNYITGEFTTKNYPLITNRGDFYIDEVGVKTVYGLIDYIETNTEKTDKIVIMPEGTFINFLTNRESDDYYNLLTPVAFETFGEQTIINRFKQVKPEYVIIHDNPMAEDYKYNNICKDYAFEFCNYLNQDYKFLQTVGFGTNFNFFIYKRIKY